MSELIDEPVSAPATAADDAPRIAQLDEAVSRCTACPRLVAWREEIARTKRAAFRDEEY